MQLRANLCILGGVGTHADDGLSGFSGQFGSGGIERIDTTGQQRNAHTLSCQGPPHRFADALATAGNEGSFAFELKVHRSESSRCLVVAVVGVKF